MNVTAAAATAAFFGGRGRVGVVSPSPAWWYIAPSPVPTADHPSGSASSSPPAAPAPIAAPPLAPRPRGNSTE